MEGLLKKEKFQQKPIAVSSKIEAHTKVGVES